MDMIERAKKTKQRYERLAKRAEAKGKPLSDDVVKVGGDLDELIERLDSNTINEETAKQMLKAARLVLQTVEIEFKAARLGVQLPFQNGGQE